MIIIIVIQINNKTKESIPYFLYMLYKYLQSFIIMSKLFGFCVVVFFYIFLISLLPLYFSVLFICIQFV